MLANERGRERVDQDGVVSFRFHRGRGFYRSMPHALLYLLHCRQLEGLRRRSKTAFYGREKAGRPAGSGHARQNGGDGTCLAYLLWSLLSHTQMQEGHSNNIPTFDYAIAKNPRSALAAWRTL